MKTLHTLARSGSLAAIAVALSSTPSHATGSAAGTLIENTATASYSTGTETRTVDSNKVVVQVDELLDVTLASQDGSALPIGSGSAILTFKLTNIGNGPEAFRLTANPAVTGNPFNTTVQSIAYDVDNNGLYDPAVDVILGSGAATPVIPADGTLTVFVLVNAPSGVTDAQTSKINLNADAVTGTGAPGTTFAGAGESGSDAVVGTTNADAADNGTVVVAAVTVDLVKSATVTNPFGGADAVPGAVVHYTIVATVRGNGSVTDLHVTDAIPTGSTYVPNSLKLGAAPLTDTSADSDGGQAGAAGIDVLIGTATAGSSYSTTFNVSIN